MRVQSTNKLGRLKVSAKCKDREEKWPRTLQEDAPSSERTPGSCWKRFCPPSSRLPSAHSPGGPLSSQELLPGDTTQGRPESRANCTRLKHLPNLINAFCTLSSSGKGAQAQESCSSIPCWHEGGSQHPAEWERPQEGPIALHETIFLHQ